MPVAPSKNRVKAISFDLIRKTFSVFQIFISDPQENSQYSTLLLKKYIISYIICHRVNISRLVKGLVSSFFNISSKFSIAIEYFVIPTFLIDEYKSR